MFNWLDNGRQYRIQFKMPRFQITEMPTLAVESRGQITRRIAGKFVPSVGRTADEIKVKVWSKDAYFG